MVRKLIQEGLRKGTDALADKLEGVGKEAKAKIYGPDAPEEDIIVSKKTGTITVKELGNSEIDAIDKAIKGVGFKGNVNYGLDFKKLGTLLKDRFDDGTVDDPFYSDFAAQEVFGLMQHIKENNAELFKYFRREKKSLIELAESVKGTPLETTIATFVGRVPGKDPLPLPEDTLAGLIASYRITDELLAIQKEQFKTQDLESKKLLSQRFALLGQIQVSLSASVSGNVSEYARGMSVVRGFATMSDFNINTYTENLNRIIKDLPVNAFEWDQMSPAEHNLMALQYSSLHPAGKKFFSKNLYNWIPKAGAKLYDTIMEIYVNSVLAAPPTHIANITGGAVFQAMLVAEKGMAARIGQVRQGIGRAVGMNMNNADRVLVGESMAEIHGVQMSLMKAFGVLGRSFITGERSDFQSKIDLRDLQAIGNEESIPAILKNIGRKDFFLNVIDIVGIMARMPGRFLASEDEFFKVLSRERVKYREAFRRASLVQQEILKANSSGIYLGNREQVQELANNKFAEVYEDILLNTGQNKHEDVYQMMKDEALESTFQNPLEGIQASFAKIANIPALKPFFFLFVKTPVNLFNQSANRAFPFSPVYKAITKGPGAVSGKEYDEALAKLATGWGIFVTMQSIMHSGIADNIVRFVSGAGYEEDYKLKGTLGPNFKGKLRQADTGKQPYAIEMKNADGNWESISLQRLDPISGTIAMMIDTALMLQNMPDDEGMLSAVTDASLATIFALAEFSSSQTYLQGMSDIMREFQNPTGEQGKAFERLGRFFGGKLVDIGTNVTGSAMGRMSFGLGNAANEYLGYPVVGATAFTGMLERMKDPRGSNTELTEMQMGDYNNYNDMPSFMVGAFKALNRAKARDPVFSASVEPSLDYWGRNIMQGEGREFTIDTPFGKEVVVRPRMVVGLGKKQIIKPSIIEDELHRITMAGGPVLEPRHRKYIEIGGEYINLTAEEQTAYNRTFNSIDENGRLPGMVGYNPELTVQNKMERIIGTEAYQDNDSIEDQYNLLTAPISDHKSLTKQILTNRKFYGININEIGSERLFKIFDTKQQEKALEMLKKGAR